MAHQIALDRDPERRSCRSSVKALSDEVFVGERNQKGVAQSSKLLESSSDLKGMERVFIEIVPGVNNDLFGPNSATECEVYSFVQEVEHLTHHFRVCRPDELGSRFGDAVCDYQERIAIGD